MKARISVALAALLALSIASANAATLTVEVTNNQPDIGFSFTPVWSAFHDGSFDGFNSGMAASSAVEAVAELGDASGLTTALGASGNASVVASSSGPPPFTPGQSASAMIDAGDATVNRYFSYASMVVPSNDLFMGNDNPMAYEVFDAAGNFLGPLTIMVYSQDVWDAGTEVNDIADGAAFVVGQDATMGTAEGGVVQPLFAVAGIDSYLSSIVGQDTPAGIIDDGLGTGELLATITITPEPSSVLLALVPVMLATIRRR